MTTLSIPKPELNYEAISPGLAGLEKPIKISCGAVTFPDGTAFDQNNLGTAGFFIYRQQTAASIEIWNKETKLWEPDPGANLDNLKPEALIFAQDQSFQWQAPLVAAGQKDKNDQNQFHQAKPDFPRYVLRAYFTGAKNGNSFSSYSAPSDPVRFISILDANRAGIQVGENQTAEDATEVVFFLRSASRQFLGSIEIKAEAGAARIEIANHEVGAQKAVIRLLPGGDVEIQPATGRKLIVSGSMEAEQIYYQPSNVGGTPVGSKKWLP